MLSNIIEICVAIDIAILGIAYPLIVNKISNIGDKYNSEYLSVIFDSEIPQKQINIPVLNKNVSVFQLVLYLTLFSFLFLIVKLHPLFGWDNVIINNSAEIIVFFLSIILTIYFLIWLNKVALYSGKSTAILIHLSQKYYQKENDEQKKQYLLKAINEMAFYAIEKQDEHLQKTLLKFYDNIFANIRRNYDKNEALIYPINLYFLVNRLNEQVAQIDNKKLKKIENRAVSGYWLLGEPLEYIKISDETYKWLWENIYAIIDKPQLIKIFWGNSVQYFDLGLQTILPEFETSEQIINEKEINNREDERKKFLEFHYALGGLILYKGHNKLLKYIFEYSQIEPPEYVLLPKSVDEIIRWMIYFSNDYENLGMSVYFKYYFPDLDNLGNAEKVRDWICSYLTLLLIRFYSLQNYPNYQDGLELPVLPEEMHELNEWLDVIACFERQFDNIRGNNELIKILELEAIMNNNEKFQHFFSELKEKINGKIEEKKINNSISETKVQKFYEKTAEIISRAFQEYEKIFNKELIKNIDLTTSINGASILASKSAFTDEEEMLYFDSFFAKSVVNSKIKQYIPNSFLVAKTKSYVFNERNINDALGKIITSKDDIVLIGFERDFYIQKLLDKSTYESIFIPYTGRSFQNTLFVLKKIDLPSIEYKDVTVSTIEEFKLTKVNNDYKIYASVIDLGKDEYHKRKWESNVKNENLNLKVQLTIAFLSHLYWKKEREIIQINIATKYTETGIQNKIDDIEPL